MYLLRVYAILVACCGVAIAMKQALPPRGSAAWVYDVDGGAPAMWASDIAAFNVAAEQPINTIFSYGGDMEYYPGSPSVYNTYFPPENQLGESVRWRWVMCRESRHGVWLNPSAMFSCCSCSYVCQYNWC